MVFILLTFRTLIWIDIPQVTTAQHSCTRLKFCHNCHTQRALTTRTMAQSLFWSILLVSQEHNQFRTRSPTKKFISNSSLSSKRLWIHLLTMCSWLAMKTETELFKLKRSKTSWRRCFSPYKTISWIKTFSRRVNRFTPNKSFNTSFQSTILIEMDLWVKQRWRHFAKTYFHQPCRTAFKQEMFDFWKLSNT